MSDEKSTEITFDGKTFRLSMPPDWMMQLETRIISRRKSPLDIACAKLDKIPVAHRQQMLDRAFDLEPRFDDYVTDQEKAQYLDTRDGASFNHWLLIKTNHPEMTLQDVESMMVKMTDDAFQQFIKVRDEVLAPEAAEPA